MTKTFLLAGVICSTTALAPAPAHAATWTLVGCANLSYSGAKICLYYGANHQGQGKLINNSSHDINNQGIFSHVSGAGSSVLCGRVTTPRNSTATCTRTLAAGGTYRLTDNYIGPRLGEESVSTASHRF